MAYKTGNQTRGQSAGHFSRRTYRNTKWHINRSEGAAFGGPPVTTVLVEMKESRLFSWLDHRRYHRCLYANDA